MTSVAGLKSILHNDQTYRADILTNNLNVIGDLNVTGDTTIEGSLTVGNLVPRSNISFRATAGGGQTIADAATATIEFPIEAFDTGDYDNSTYIFTASTAGYYMVTATIVLDNSSAISTGSQFGAIIDKNGVTYRVVYKSPIANFDLLTATNSTVVQLAVSDTIQIKVSNSTGATIKMDSSSSFTMYLLSEI